MVFYLYSQNKGIVEDHEERVQLAQDLRNFAFDFLDLTAKNKLCIL